MSNALLQAGHIEERCRRHLFQVSNKLKNAEITIEDIGDYLPGSVMVQDFLKMTNTYMNQHGCEILKHSAEELELLGPSYFDLFFPKEEIEPLLGQISAFIKMEDHSRINSFFQRVRPDTDTDYKWYLTTSRLCTFPENCIMHIAIEVGSLHNTGKILGQFVENNDYINKHYTAFCQLTRREKEIIGLIATGKSCSEISDLLFISLHTVHNHRKNINKKLEISSIHNLIKFARAFDL